MSMIETSDRMQEDGSDVLYDEKDERKKEGGRGAGWRLVVWE